MTINCRQIAKKNLPVIQAYAEGKEIQFRLKGMAVWKDFLDSDAKDYGIPALLEDFHDWRIKPKFETRWIVAYPTGEVCSQLFSTETQAKLFAQSSHRFNTEADIDRAVVSIQLQIY